MTPDVSVSRDINAPAATVWAAITDITRMGEWSPETYEAAWNDGFDTAAMGARWTGKNRNGDLEWVTEAEVTEFVEGERFVFDCDWKGYVFATWGYEITPTDTGCTVTEFTSDHRPEEAKAGSSTISGVDDREAHNTAGMHETLARLAAACEA